MKTEYKYVPVVPTDEMIEVALNIPFHAKHPFNVYKAMLAAAPEQPGHAEPLDRKAIRNESPKVPGNICQLIEAYGNARADHDICSPALCELLTALCEWGVSLKSQPAQPSDSQAEVSDTEKDAARYRWLRNNSADKFYGGSDKAPAVFNVDDEFNHGPKDHLEGEDLDKAVDAAKKAQEQS